MSLSYLPYWFLFGGFFQLFSFLLLHLLFTVWLTTSGGLASRVQRQEKGNRTGRRVTCCCLTILPKEWSCLVDRGWSAQAAVYCIDGATTSHCLPPTFYPPPPPFPLPHFLRQTGNHTPEVEKETLICRLGQKVGQY